MRSRRSVLWGASALAALAAVLLAAGPAMGAPCVTSELYAKPVDLGDIRVRPYRTTTDGAVSPATQENCVFLENVGPSTILAANTSVDHQIELPGAGMPGPFEISSFSSINISGGVPVTCSTAGGEVATTASTFDLAAGAITDICCFVWDAGFPGTCDELPQAGDIVNHSMGAAAEADMPLLGYIPVGGSTCGLIGLEVVLVLPLLGRLRRARRSFVMRRSLALLATSLLLLLLVTSPALAVDVVLSVHDSTAIDATISSMGEDAEAASLSGTIVARLQLTEHPLHGLVAQSVEILSGNLAIGDLGWALSGPNESLTASLSDGEASAASSGPIIATPVATNTSDLPTSDVVLTISGGELSAMGSVVDHGILLTRAFASDPRPIGLMDTAQIVTTEAGSGNGTVDVALTVPISFGVPLDPPFIVTVLELQGDLVLTGTTLSTLPASPAGPWLGVVLAVAGWAAVRRRTRGAR